MKDRKSAVRQFWFFLTLVGLWCLLENSISIGNVLLGSAGAFLALFIVREPLMNSRNGRNYFRHPLRLVYLGWIFISELVMGSIAIARMLLQPRSKWTYAPGIIAVPLTTRDDVEITLFANMITMIPGTIAVDISEDKSILYMHVLDASDPDDQTLDTEKGNQITYVKRAFEKPIMWAMEQ